MTTSLTPSSVQRVLIVGGGIAGLALGRALGQTGVRCEIAELHDRTDGASIGITARAVYALESLGVLEACRAAGRSLEGPGTVFSTMYDGHGDPVPMPPIPPRTDTRLPAALSIYRPAFARILRDAAESAGVNVRTGISVTSLESDESGVDVVFTDGTSDRYDLVVGADGIRSTVRGLLYGHGPDMQPKDTGHTSLRTLFHGPHAGKPGFFNVGRDTVAITHLPGDMTYLATGVDVPPTPLTQEEARQHLREILGRYSFPYLASLRDRIGPEQKILAHRYEWLWVPAPWHRGRIALIGDAAHATTAHLSSGGGMALEDAVVLAEELGRHPDVPTALDAFMARRKDRVQLVVDTSVELVRLQQAGADMRVMGPLRGRAMFSLQFPY